jgi:hypothetical protein
MIMQQQCSPGRTEVPIRGALALLTGFLVVA